MWYLQWVYKEVHYHNVVPKAGQIDAGQLNI